MDKKYKILIPKYLTLFRIFITPIILILSILKLNIPLAIIVILTFISTILDNILNKLWQVNSKSRVKLDLLANKVFILGIVGSLMFKYHILIIVFVLEIIISIINIYFYSKKNKMEILKIGKWKECILSITILTYILLSISFGKLNICYGFTYVSINLEFLAIIHYLVFYITYKVPSIESNVMHQEIMNDESLEQTIVLENISSLDKEIYDIEKDLD